MNPTNDTTSAHSNDPYRFHVWGLVLLIFFLPALIVWLYIAEPHTPKGPPPTKVVSSAVVDQAGGIDKLLSSELFTDGRNTFITSCTACHGPEGQAKPYLGKDIANSAFVAQLTDEKLLDFLETGRPADDPLNTTGVPMPPKGGNPDLTDAQLQQIIAYIRVLEAAAKGDIQLPPTPTG